MPEKADKKPARKDRSASEAPEKAKAKKKEKPRGLERLPIAAHVVAQVLLTIILFGTFNYLSYRHHKRLDVSANRKYTVSDETASFLESVDQPIRITMSFLQNSLIRGNLKALLERYEELSRGQITFDDIDPARDRNRAAELKDHLTSPPFSGNAVIIEIGGRHKIIKESEMLDAEGRFFRGEDAVTSSLISVLEGEPKKVYIVAGKGTMMQVGERTLVDLLVDASRSHFFEIEFLTLSEVDAIPADTGALFFPGLQVDLNPREVKMIRHYWESERGSMIVLLDPASETPIQDAFLTDYGITPRDDRVLEASGLGTKNFEVEAAFLIGSPVNRYLAGLTTLLPGITCSLEVADNEKLTKRGIGIIALAQGGERFWGEVNFDDPRPVLDEEDTSPPVYVAASVEIGATEDQRLRLETSRMVLIGNSRLLDPDVVTSTNANFVTGAINWVLNREELIGIPPKTATTWQIALTPVQHKNMFNLVVFVLPAIVLSVALVMWSLRRA